MPHYFDIDTIWPGSIVRPSVRPSVVADDAPQRKRGERKTCNCRAGCLFTRCGCVVNRLRCTAACRCAGLAAPHACRNPVNQLRAVGLTIDHYGADSCMMANIFRVRHRQGPTSSGRERRGAGGQLTLSRPAAWRWVGNYPIHQSFVCTQIIFLLSFLLSFFLLFLHLLSFFTLFLLSFVILIYLCPVENSYKKKKVKIALSWRSKPMPGWTSCVGWSQGLGRDFKEFSNLPVINFYN